MKSFEDMSKNHQHQTSAPSSCSKEPTALPLLNKIAEPENSIHVGANATKAAVYVARPPKITVVMAPSISRPGSPLPIAIGRRPRPANRAVLESARDARKLLRKFGLLWREPSVNCR